jgi:hypothetical protein
MLANDGRHHIVYFCAKASVAVSHGAARGEARPENTPILLVGTNRRFASLKEDEFWTLNRDAVR